MKRRFFLFAAPAIVAAPSLMRVSALVLPPKETLHELMARRIKAAERAMMADLERVYWNTDWQSPGGGLQALLTEDMPAVGGIDRTGFAWYSQGVTIYGRG